MKKAIFILIIIGFMSGTVLVSCQPAAKKEQEAQEDLMEAQKDLNEAKQDAAAEEEWQAYRDEINSKIDANETQIAELKTKMKKSEKSLESVYAQSIKDLEKRNKDLKMRLTDYKNDASSDWQSFKKELDHDVDELDQAVKDITVKIKNQN